MKNRSAATVVLGLMLATNSSGAAARAGLATARLKPAATELKTRTTTVNCPRFEKGAEGLIDPHSYQSPLDGLVLETNIPELRPHVQVWVTLRKEIFLEKTLHNGVPACVATKVISASASNTVCVLIHGLFGKGDDWRYMAGALRGEYELWIIDLPGAGKTVCPEPSDCPPGSFTPEAMAERVLQALASRLEARPDVSRIIMVGHSYGGMVALRMFMDDDLRRRYAGVLEKVNGYVLLAPCNVSVTQATPSWLTFLGINATKARVGTMMRILQDAVVASLRQGFCRSNLISRELAIEGIQLLQNGKNRRIMQQIMLEAITWREFGKRIDRAAVGRLEASYRHVRVPCLIIWGKCDETLPDSMGHELTNILPNARLVLLRDTMHLLPLERPALCADLLRQFDEQLVFGSLAAARSIETIETESESIVMKESQSGARPQRGPNGSGNTR